MLGCVRRRPLAGILRFRFLTRTFFQDFLGGFSFFSLHFLSHCVFFSAVRGMIDKTNN